MGVHFLGILLLKGLLCNFITFLSHFPSIKTPQNTLSTNYPSPFSRFFSNSSPTKNQNQNQTFTQKKSQLCLQKNPFKDVWRSDHLRLHTCGEVEKPHRRLLVAQPEEGRQRQISELEEEEEEQL